MGSHRLRLTLTIALAAVILGLATTALLAAAGPLSNRRRVLDAPAASCATPTLAGAVVDVSLTDMGGIMGPGMMGNGPFGPGAANNGYPWQNGYPWPGMGMMRIFIVPPAVAAGAVSLRVHNTGA
jgi:hypothetical protein